MKHPVVKNADATTGDRIVRAWENGFWESVHAARESDVFMPRDWMERSIRRKPGAFGCIAQGTKRMMDQAEIYSAFLQADAEADRCRKQLERQAWRYESMPDGEAKIALSLKVAKTIEKMNAADEEADKWAAVLERR